MRDLARKAAIAFDGLGFELAAYFAFDASQSFLARQDLLGGAIYWPITLPRAADGLFGPPSSPGKLRQRD